MTHLHIPPIRKHVICSNCSGCDHFTIVVSQKTTHFYDHIIKYNTVTNAYGAFPSLNVGRFMHALVRHKSKICGYFYCFRCRQILRDRWHFGLWRRVVHRSVQYYAERLEAVAEHYEGRKLCDGIFVGLSRRYLQNTPMIDHPSFIGWTNEHFALLHKLSEKVLRSLKQS